MAYKKQTWKSYNSNDPIALQPEALITPERLNHIEEGLANAVNTGGSSSIDNVSCTTGYVNETCKTLSSNINVTNVNGNNNITIDLDLPTFIANDARDNTAENASVYEDDETTTLSSYHVQELFKNIDNDYSDVNFDLFSNCKDKYNTVEERLAALEEGMRAVKLRVYGVEWDMTSSDTKGKRTDNSIGMTAGIQINNDKMFNDFDLVYPYNRITRCNGYVDQSTNQFVVSAYMGEEGSYFEDGRNGNVYVEIPFFYYYKEYDETGTKLSLKICSEKYTDDYKVPTKFINSDGTYKDKIYIPAYKFSYFYGTISLASTSYSTGILNKCGDHYITSRACYTGNRVWMDYTKKANKLYLDQLGQGEGVTISNYLSYNDIYSDELSGMNAFAGGLLYEDYEIIYILAMVEFADRNLKNIMSGCKESDKLEPSSINRDRYIYSVNYPETTYVSSRYNTTFTFSTTIPDDTIHPLDELIQNLNNQSLLYIFDYKNPSSNDGLTNKGVVLLPPLTSDRCNGFNYTKNIDNTYTVSITYNSDTVANSRKSTVDGNVYAIGNLIYSITNTYTDKSGISNGVIYLANTLNTTTLDPRYQGRVCGITNTLIMPSGIIGTKTCTREDMGKYADGRFRYRYIEDAWGEEDDFANVFLYGNKYIYTSIQENSNSDMRANLKTLMSNSTAISGTMVELEYTTEFNGNGTNYIKTFGEDKNYPLVMLPKEIATDGSSNNYYASKVISTITRDNSLYRIKLDGDNIFDMNFDEFVSSNGNVTSRLSLLV